MVAQNELRDARDRQNANDQAIATELNRYQSQIEHFRKGFYMNIQFHIELRTLQCRIIQTCAYKIRIQDMKMIHSRVICH